MSRADGSSPIRLVLLGTKGGPRPRPGAAGPSQVVLIGKRPILIDCGEGVVQRLLEAGIALDQVQDILITHHHSDHNVALGNVLMANWASGGQDAIRVLGPPPVSGIVDHLLAANAPDIEIRVADEGRVDLRELIEATDLTRPGQVYEDGSITITAALVDHPPVEPAFAYRVESGGKSVVVSGDTTPSKGLIDLAVGADVLVHEVIHVDYLEDREEDRSNADSATLRAHLLRSHTPVSEVGRIAAEAGVETLVLSHLVPSYASLPESAWLDPVREQFSGRVVLGRDLMTIDL